MKNWLLLSICLAGAVRAETHRVEATTYYSTFSHANPILKRIRPGDTVITRTVDGNGVDQNNVPHAWFSNPLTGPFYVEGAEPGDALIVHLKRVTLTRNSGYSANRMW